MNFNGWHKYFSVHAILRKQSVFYNVNFYGENDIDFIKMNFSYIQ